MCCFMNIAELWLAHQGVFLYFIKGLICETVTISDVQFNIIKEKVNRINLKIRNKGEQI